MNRKQKIILLIILITLAYITPVAVDAAQTVEGHMEALDCIIHGKPCPTDNLDPHMALVTDFVLFLGKGSEHYLLPNIPRNVKAQYIGKAIRVTGEVNKTYRAIKAKKLEIKRSASYKIVWSRESKRDEWEKWQKGFYRGRLDGH
jgi:hypothetical protein